MNRGSSETPRWTLSTSTIMLRPIETADLDDLVALHSDPVVMRFLTGGRPADRATVERQADSMRRTYECIDGAPGFWAAEERPAGGFVGWFELRPIDPGTAHTLELGYRLGRSSWGKGYATAGSRLLIDHALTQWDTEIITANTMTVNAASRRVMERCGLSFVRTFFTEFDTPSEGMEHGEVEYQLTRKDWQQRRDQASG